jgi:excisionase family DNA binding protein
MAELLTVKQIQTLLKIDRVTVYRMLNDGRLKGVKVGNQWRFPQSEIDRILGEERPASDEVVDQEALTDFPADCVEKIQNIFAGILDIGAVTVTLQGEALTRVCFSNPFCERMLASPSGCQACQDSWRRLALRVTGAPPFMVCHAGLSYLRAAIKIDDQPVAWLIAGQFYTASQDKERERLRLGRLANKHGINAVELIDAAQSIPVLKTSQQAQVQEWTPKVANTIDSILRERSDLMCRLQKIADLSTVRSVLPR